MPRPLIAWVLALLPAIAVAATPEKVLKYSLSGLEGELKNNAVAWLGEAPESTRERLGFVVTAEEKIRLSLQALGYYRPVITVDVDRTPPVWRMQIAVQPGEPVRIRSVSLQLLGEAAEDAAFDQLLSNLPFAAGDVLRHDVYEQYKRRLLSTGLQRGYFDGRIVSRRVEVEADAGRAEIQLQYDGGRRYRFGAIEFDPGQVTAEQLAALSPFVEGDYFDQAGLQGLQAQLQRTRYYSGVTLRPNLEEAREGVVPLSLKLIPAKRHSFETGIGYSTDTEERLSVTWRSPKLNRFGHSQETRLEYSRVNPSGRISYRIPLTHPLDDALHLSARLEDNEYGDLNSRQLEYGVRRENRWGPWIRSYALRSLDESWGGVGEHDNNNYLLAGFSLSRRERWGPMVDPGRGLSQIYQIELGDESLGSDIDLLRATARLGYLFTPAPGHRLVGRVDLGAALVANADRNDLAPSLNFFAGGAQSLRGYGYQSVGNEIQRVNEQGTEETLVVGGDRLVTGSIEYQYYFKPNWRGALFLDGGDAFDEGEFDLHIGAGFGVHYLTPVGAIRVELARPVGEDDNSWRLHLTIGAEF
jgi:translocation and assembly module TamA